MCVRGKESISSLFELLIRIYQLNSFSLVRVGCFLFWPFISHINFLCVCVCVVVVAASVVYASYRQERLYFLHIPHKCDYYKKKFGVEMRKKNLKSIGEIINLKFTIRNAQAHSFRIQCDNF